MPHIRNKMSKFIIAVLVWTYLYLVNFCWLWIEFDIILEISAEMEHSKDIQPRNSQNVLPRFAVFYYTTAVTITMLLSLHYVGLVGYTLAMQLCLTTDNQVIEYFTTRAWIVFEIIFFMLDGSLFLLTKYGNEMQFG